MGFTEFHASRLKNLALYHKEFEIFTNEFFIFIWLECGLCVFVG